MEGELVPSFFSQGEITDFRKLIGMTLIVAGGIDYLTVLIL